MGYTVQVPQEVFAASGYLAGDDLNRATLLNRLVADAEVRAILCARGGFGSMRLLEAIDYRQAEAQPKYFMGFSDVTALLAAFHRCSHLVVFHGPTVSQLADADPATVEAMARVLSGALTVSLPAEEVLRPGNARGPLMGGNLTTLCHLVGTPYFPSLTGSILLLEDRGEALYRVDRMLQHLKLAGCLKGIAGLALGRFDDCLPAQGLRQLVTERFREAEIPILAGLPVGHGALNRAIPLGLPAVLDTDRLQLRIMRSKPLSRPAAGRSTPHPAL